MRPVGGSFSTGEVLPSLNKQVLVWNSKSLSSVIQTHTYFSKPLFWVLCVCCLTQMYQSCHPNKAPTRTTGTAPALALVTITTRMAVRSPRHPCQTTGVTRSPLPHASRSSSSTSSRWGHKPVLMALSHNSPGLASAWHGSRQTWPNSQGAGCLQKA